MGLAVAMQITHPLVLLLFIPAAAGVYFLAARSLARRPWMHFALRLLICAGLMLSAAGFELRRSDYAAERFFLLDMSASTGLQAGHMLKRIRRAARKLHPRDRMAVIVLGREPLVEFGPASPANFKHEGITAPVDASATDLEAALKLVRSLHRDGAPAQVVLISDGIETTGSASREVVRLAAEGIAVYCLPVGRSVPDVRVRFVEYPQMVRPQQAFAAVIEVAGEGAADISVRTDEGRVVAGRLLVDGRKLWRCELSLEKPGLHTIDATVTSPADGITQNNTCTAAVWVSGPVSLLWIGGRPSGLAAAVQRAGMAVEQAGPAHLPADAAALNAYDAVVIEDAPAASFHKRSLEALSHYVRSMGGGLIMLGGAGAFGPGGYIDSPVEGLLPVECDALEEKSKPVALVLVIDRSGSMAETVRQRTKLSYAQEAVLQVIRELKEGDRIAVIAFNASADVIKPLGPAGDAREIEQRVLSLDPFGSTDLNAPLRAALAQVGREGDESRRVILLSDGLSKEVDAAWPAKFAEAGVSVSVVATGEAVNQSLLRGLAEGTGGRYYPVDRIDSIAEIFSQEARASNDKLLRHSPAGFPTKLAATPLVAGLAPPPAIAQYVLVKPRDRAEVALTVDGGKPLLARWRCGLGRSIAFAAPAGVLETWPDAGALWARAIAWVARPAADPAVAATVAVSGDRAQVEVAAPETACTDLRAVVLMPNGQTADVWLQQAAPGLYSGAFPVADAGVYPITIVERVGGEEMVKARAAAVVSYPSEYARIGINRALLDEISSATGGGIIDDPVELPPSADGGAAFVNVGWVPALIALLLFLVDLAIS